MDEVEIGEHDDGALEALGAKHGVGEQGARGGLLVREAQRVAPEGVAAAQAPGLLRAATKLGAR